MFKPLLYLSNFSVRDTSDSNAEVLIMAMYNTRNINYLQLHRKFLKASIWLCSHKAHFQNAVMYHFNEGGKWSGNISESSYNHGTPALFPCYWMTKKWFQEHQSFCSKVKLFKVLQLIQIILYAPIIVLFQKDGYLKTNTTPLSLFIYFHSPSQFLFIELPCLLVK